MSKAKLQAKAKQAKEAKDAREGKPTKQASKKDVEGNSDEKVRKLGADIFLVVFVKH